MTNLATEQELSELICNMYDLQHANRDAAQLHKLNRKATLATAMIDQEIAELQKDLQALEERRKEILEPLHLEMEQLKTNLITYHQRELDMGGEKTIKLPWATLKSRLQPQDYERSEETLLIWAQASAPEFIKTPAPAVNWGDLKKAVVVAGNKVLLKETGEVVAGVLPKQRETRFDVEVL